MKTTDALKALLECDKRGLWLYDANDFAKVFDEDGDTLKATISRLQKTGFIKPVVKGLYEFRYSDSSIVKTPDEVALRLRRGHAVFESLESAASKWGVISQIPVGSTMYMTTGRSGLFETSYGRIEFVHTKMSPAEIYKNTVSRGPFRTRIASEELTKKNLKATRRSLDLIGDGEA